MFQSLELMQNDENSKKNFVQNIRDKLSTFFSRKPASSESSETPVIVKRASGEKED